MEQYYLTTGCSNLIILQDSKRQICQNNQISIRFYQGIIGYAEAETRQPPITYV